MRRIAVVLGVLAACGGSDEKLPKGPIAAQVTHVAPDVVARAYDRIMPMFSDTGRFDPQATAVLAQSFVDLKLLPKKPDMTKLYTEKFLPAAAK